MGGRIMPIRELMQDEILDTPATVGVRELSPDEPLDNDNYVPTEKLAIGIWEGIKDFGRGIKQFYLWQDEMLGFNPPGTTQEYTQQAEDIRRKYSESPVAQSLITKTGKFIGETVPYMAIPGPGKGAGLLKQTAYGAGVGGLIGATQFTPDTDSKLKTTLTGAGIGAAIPPIVKGIGAVAGKISNTIKGIGKSPDIDELMGLSKQHDVPLAYPDIAGGPVAPKVGTYLEQLPLIGMGGYRKDQHDKALLATKRLIGDSMEDWPEVAKEGLLARAKGIKAVASRYYDNFTKKADALGDIPIDNTMTAVNSAIQAESHSKIPDKGIISMLNEVKTKLTGNMERVEQPLGVYTEIPVMHNKASNLRDFRSDLGIMISDYYNGKNAIIGEKGVGLLQSIRKTIDDDISVWAKDKGGGLYQSWRNADKYYKTQVIPYREQQIFSKIAKEGDHEAIYKLFKGGIKNKPQTLYDGLPARGKNAIKQGILQDAYNKATNYDHTMFSPAKFAQALEKEKAAVGVFFKGSDKVEVDGFIKLMRHATRAGQYMENPPTGNRNWVTALMSGGLTYLAIESPVTAAASVGITGFTRLLFTTEVGKKFLLTSSRLQPGTEAMQKFINTNLPKVMAAYATEQQEAQ